jgi:hypothetical protein
MLQWLWTQIILLVQYLLKQHVIDHIMHQLYDELQR